MDVRLIKNQENSNFFQVLNKTVRFIDFAYRASFIENFIIRRYYRNISQQTTQQINDF